MNKKGVSIIIGYVLLVTFAIIMGGILYQWLKGYVPKDILKCPDGVSAFIEDVGCIDHEDYFVLNLTLKNNGRFGIAGYFIHATDDPSQELATVDLSTYHFEGGNKDRSAILFSLVEDNPIKPNDRKRSRFNLSSQIYSIEITPVRFQVENNKKRLASCGDAKVKEIVTCGEE